MRHRVGRGRRAAWVAIVGLAVAACGGEGGERSGEPAAEPVAIAVPDPAPSDNAGGGPGPREVPGDASDSGAVQDSGGVSDSAAVDDGPALPPIPGEGELREYGLLLVNPHEREARVFASAGAARVALDTVPPRDSVRVDVRVRADRILLEAEDERGAGIGSLELDLVAGETNRWEIGPRPGRRPSAAGAPRTAMARMTPVSTKLAVHLARGRSR